MTLNVTAWVGQKSESRMQAVAKLQAAAQHAVGSLAWSNSRPYAWQAQYLTSSCALLAAADAAAIRYRSGCAALSCAAYVWTAFGAK
jgi:hypothetical protein